MMDMKESKVDQAPTVEKDVALGEIHDIGANLYVEAEQLSTEELEQEGAKVLRILDWRIMPIVSGTGRRRGQILFTSIVTNQLLITSSST